MKWLAPLLLAGLLLGACGGDNDEATAPDTTASGAVRTLSNVLELRAAFESDPGKTRLLLLFSPT